MLKASPAATSQAVPTALEAHTPAAVQVSLPAPTPDAVDSYVKPVPVPPDVQTSPHAPTPDAVGPCVKPMPVLAPLLAAIAACESAWTRDPSSTDRQAACDDPAAPKDRLFEYMTFGVRLHQRREDRARLAGDSRRANRLCGLQVLCALPVIATFGLAGYAAISGRWLYEGVTDTPGKLRRRSPEGVREDMMLRALSALTGADRTYKLQQAFGDPAQVAPIKARFQALESAIVEHPSARLRGSPELRKALGTVGAELRVCYSPAAGAQA